MSDIELMKTDIHNELLRVKDPPKDQKDRTRIATRLRAAAKREGSNATIAQRNEEIYVALSDAAQKALPAGAGRGRKGLRFSELVERAKGS